MSKNQDANLGCLSLLVFGIAIGCIVFYFTGDMQISIGTIGFVILAPFLFAISAIILVTIIAGLVMFAEFIVRKFNGKG